MSRARKGSRRAVADTESNRSGFAAIATQEDPDGDEDDDPPPDDPQSTTLLTETMAELPWKGLSYEDYKHDMSYIVRYVSPAGFWELGNPLVGWSADYLAQAYKDQNVTLKRGNTTAVGKIIAALIRWRIVPGTLYEHRLILDSYDKLLDELLESLQECELQWVSDRADEPAEFWLSPDWQVGVPANTLNGITVSSKEMKTKLCQPVQQLRSIPRTTALYSAESQNLHSGLQNPKSELLTPQASPKMQALDAFVSLASDSQEASLLSVEQIPGNAVKPESKIEVPAESNQRCFRKIPCEKSALDDGTMKQAIIWRGDFTRVHWLRVNNVASCLKMVVVLSVYQVAYPKLVGIQITAEQARDEAMIGNEFKVFDRGKVKGLSESDSTLFESVSVAR